MDIRGAVGTGFRTYLIVVMSRFREPAVSGRRFVQMLQLTKDPFKLTVNSSNPTPPSSSLLWRCSDTAIHYRKPTGPC
jgi:hypothetical protein